MLHLTKFQIRAIAVLPGIDFLLLERLEKAFAPCIVLGVAGPAQ
jgi:hypothetical protein